MATGAATTAVATDETTAGTEVPSPAEHPACNWFCAHAAQAMLGVSSQELYRSLTLKQAGSSSTVTGDLWQPVALWGGMTFYYSGEDARRRTGLRGEMALGLGFLPQNLNLPLIFRYATSWVQPLGKRWSLVAGLSFSLAVDLPNAQYPYGLVGAPLGIAWDIVELTWTPSFQFPLALSSQTVFDGTLQRGAAVAFVPISFALSFRF